MNNKKDK